MALKHNDKPTGRGRLGQLIPVGIGTVVFGTLFGLIGLVTGQWSLGESYAVVYTILFMIWVLGVIFGARA